MGYHSTKNRIKFRFFSAFILLLGMASFANAQTYCVPEGTNAGRHINNFSTTGGILNISNLASGFSTDGYGDFTATHTVSQVALETINFSADILGGTSGFRIWVDWNQDGVFDANEVAYNSTSYGSSHSGSFDIPITALGGETRMRIVSHWLSTTADIPPCQTGFTYGEFEDYTLDVVLLTTCSGTPTAGPITGANTACLGVDLSLEIPTVLESEITYTWQSSPAGLNTWTNITGASSNAYTAVGGIVNDTDFRAIVTCDASSLSDTSAVHEVVMLPPTECYCTPSTSSTSYFIDSISTTGAIQNVNNGSTGLGANGYQDFTMSDTITQMQTQEVSFYAKGSGTGTAGAKIWVDWNGNGVFENDELVYSSSSYSNNHQGTFEVPLNAVAGVTRMRIGWHGTNNSGPTGPCQEGLNGEFEDYTFEVVALPDCTGLPSISAISGNTGACLDVDVEMEIDPIAASGITYQWQESPSGINTWTDIVGANSNDYMILNGITADTDFRVIATCANSSLSDTSNVHEVVVLPPSECYCTPSTNSTSYFIDSFSTTGAIGNIVNGATGLGTNGYQDFTLTDTIAQMQTEEVSFFAKGGSGTAGAKIWIDWNKNGVFDNDEIVYVSSGYSNIHQGTFEVPLNAVAGVTRMRIGWHGTNNSGPTGPCQENLNGEFEDYTFEVLPLPDCSTVSTPSAWSAVVDMDSLCVSGDVNITVNELIIASNVTYQLQQSTDGTTWTNVGVALEAPEFIVTDVDEHTYFRVQWLCNNTVTGASANVEIVINNPEVISTTDGYHCGPGQVVLEAQVAPGEIAKWYESPTDQLPIHEGTTFTTPLLNASNTYYVSAGTGSAPQPEEYVGAGTGAVTGSPQPFYTTYWGSKNQYLIKASELQALGYTAGKITDVVFDVVNANGMDLDNFEMKLGMTNDTAMSTTFVTAGMQSVYTGNATEILTANSEKGFELDTYFLWDGVSNIILETCFNNDSYSGGNSVRYSTNLGFKASLSKNVDNATVCSQTTGSTYTSRPNIKFHMQSGCESNRVAVQAVIKEEPVIDLGEDLAACEGHVFTLDAGAGFDSYLWSDHSTGQTIDITTTGVYTVEVGLDGCFSEDEVTVIFSDAPVSLLEDEIVSCDGELIALDAGSQGPESEYLWSTGETDRVIFVEEPGTYTVNIFNGACDIDDEVVVTIIEQSTGESIHNTELGERLFQFYVVNPINVESYLWDFGDGTTSTDAEPIHEFTGFGSYDVSVQLNQQSCFDGDSLMRHIIVRSVDIDELVKSDKYLKLYPNPASHAVTIELEEKLQMKSVMIQDISGRVIMERQFEEMTSQVNLSTESLSSGIYQVVIDTNEGRFVRKLEIIK